MEKIILVVLIVIGALFLIAKFPGIAIIVIGIIVFFVSIIVIKSVQYSENKKNYKEFKKQQEIQNSASVSYRSNALRNMNQDVAPTGDYFSPSYLSSFNTSSRTYCIHYPSDLEVCKYCIRSRSSTTSCYRIDYD